MTSQKIEEKKRTETAKKKIVRRDPRTIMLGWRREGKGREERASLNNKSFRKSSRGREGGREGSSSIFFCFPNARREGKIKRWRKKKKKSRAFKADEGGWRRGKIKDFFYSLKWRSQSELPGGATSQHILKALSYKKKQLLFWFKVFLTWANAPLSNRIFFRSFVCFQRPGKPGRSRSLAPRTGKKKEAKL